MKDKIWNSVEEAVAEAIARIAIEVLETGVVLVTRKLKAMREEKEGASDDAPSTPTETSNLIHLFTPGKKLHFDELVNQSGGAVGRRTLTTGDARLHSPSQRRSVRQSRLV